VGNSSLASKTGKINAGTNFGLPNRTPVVSVIAVSGSTFHPSWYAIPSPDQSTYKNDLLSHGLLRTSNHNALTRRSERRKQGRSFFSHRSSSSSSSPFASCVGVVEHPGVAMMRWSLFAHRRSFVHSFDLSFLGYLRRARR
jgi:hypothetical protein